MALRLGYNTNGFAHHGLLDACDVLAGLGYTAVGLTLDVHHAPPGATDFTALGRELGARGLLPVVETGARFLLDPRRKHSPSLVSAQGRARRLDFYFRCLDAAAGLGAPCISLWSGRDEGGDSWAWLVAGLSEVCDRAGAVGVDVGFEPEPGMFVETMGQYGELRRRLDHPRLRLTLDVGHVRCLERDAPHAVVERHAPELCNVHLDDHRRATHEHLFFGEGEIDFAPLMRALAGAGRDRELPATVELSRHSHDAVETARRAYDFLAPLLTV
ncbi:MAG: sugar phosphate isomerase/epimerase family protein [Planctomycetota bacterium]